MHGAFAGGAGPPLDEAPLATFDRSPGTRLYTVRDPRGAGPPSMVGFAPGGHHYAGATKDEVARVACRLVSTDKKQRNTALYTTKEADGTSLVTQIAIRGEMGSHVLVLEPQS